MKRGRFALVWRAPTKLGSISVRLELLKRGKPVRVLQSRVVRIVAPFRPPRSRGSAGAGSGAGGSGPGGSGAGSGGIGGTGSGPGGGSPDATKSTLSCSPATLVLGNSTTCTVLVSDVTASPSAPTGNLTVSNGSTVLGTCPLVPTGASSAASCAATYTPSSAGIEKIVASYSGDSQHASGASPSSTLIVQLPVTAAAVSTPVGSTAEIAVPSPVTQLTTIDPLSSAAPPGLSAQLDNGEVDLGAAMGTATGSYTLSITGQGCTSEGCSIPMIVTDQVAVTGIEAPAGSLEEVTDPSPDRVAQASDDELQDELLIMLGSADSPGTRAQADAAAGAVDGFVSGGMSDAGIYQIRWSSPQDLTARTSQLESQPDVTSVSASTIGLNSDQSAYPEVDPAFDQPDYTWRYDQIDAQSAWNVSTGSNVTVGIIDGNSVDPAHGDLTDVKELNPVAPATFGGDPENAEHATHVAGLACAKAYNAGMVGTAWGCPIVSARIAATGSDADTMLAMQQMTTVPGVRVVNMSLGYPTWVEDVALGNGVQGCGDANAQQKLEAHVTHSEMFFRRLLAGIGKNIVWTFPAGNNCLPEATSPYGADSDLANVITVGATNSDGSLASFSNYGTNVNVAAPGGVVPSSPALDVDRACEGDPISGGTCGLLSTLFTSCGGLCDSYGEMSGTSMAAPIVAGVAADVIGANPTLSADQVGHCIKSTAGTDGVGSTSPPDGQPGGTYRTAPVSYSGPSLPIVNAAAAVTCAEPSAPAGGQIAAGGSSMCVIVAGGAVDCWGSDWGHGPFTEGGPGPMAPTRVPGIVNAVAISGGGYNVGARVCALLSDRQVSCWTVGPNMMNPQPVAGLGAVTEIAATADHACALLAGGTVECWGQNDAGQLGNGTTTTSNTPVPVNGLAGATSIAVAQSSSCAILTGGALRCWGQWFGQGSPATTPTAVANVSGASALSMRSSAGSSPGIAVVAAGGEVRQVTGTTSYTLNLTGASAVAQGVGHLCALVSGEVWCNGNGAVGDLGNGSTGGISGWVDTGLGDASALAATDYSTCALTTTGVRCWGNDDLGELGDGRAGYAMSPVPAAGISGASAVAGGSYYRCALVSGGAVDCWGDDDSGQLGHASTATPPDDPTPTPVSGITGATAIGAGDAHACAVLSGGSVSCWGSNTWGELGDGSTGGSSSTPVAVTGLTGATAVAADDGQTCALLQSGGVDCWGQAAQLVNGYRTDSATPVPVSGVTDAVSIAASTGAFCAVLGTGAVSCWTTESPTPTQVSGLTGATIIAAGGQFCALVAGGQASCFSPGVSSPTLVNGLTGATSLAGSDSLDASLMCAAGAAGQAWCWGNENGQELEDYGSGSYWVLGSATQVSLGGPVSQVMGSGDGVCAVRTDGTVVCDGFDQFGELGAGYMGYTATPTPVSLP